MTTPTPDTCEQAAREFLNSGYSTVGTQRAIEPLAALIRDREEAARRDEFAKHCVCTFEPHLVLCNFHKEREEAARQGNDAHTHCFEPVSDYLEEQLNYGVPCYEDTLPAVKALQEAARREGWKAGAEAMREKAASVAEGAYSCSCDEAYTSRRLVAPDCFKHQACDEAAAQIRALPLPEMPTK